MSSSNIETNTKRRNKTKQVKELKTNILGDQDSKAGDCFC